MVRIEGLTELSASEILNSDISKSLKKFLDEKKELTPEQINFYHNNGFVKVKDVVTEEYLPELRRIIEAAVLIRKGKDERDLKQKSQYEQSFLQCGYLCWDFPAVKEIVFSKRFAGIVKDLMQAEHIRLWHDQALFKEPGGRITDAHQDCSYWPIHEPQFTSTMWLALVDVPVEKGCLYFYPRTNDPKLREYVDIFRNPHQPEFLKKEEKVFMPLKAGEATFHSGLTFHGAGENKTNQMREAMTIIYIKDGVTFDSSDERNKTHTSCIGLNEGEIINTKYTPILI
ncbi:Phytanoyl-CoA dioxygenase [Ignavibacterium album JCM 16511]|uniref:Phytanoyl-CoA dioxygenase n=1 Tax=Ignavibacterium album (strain DSM 19864 / JCM 16511 / NBRC 101810 / Mat9-16) TaxID=945713 RepID=I0AI81_IGNAJ|nr:phytanoyl-CoA dioxygenase family protein [Ignavibacterium album]AFH48688.1 Phytanoyl-CoA dioxygenase [Ignavibacterium album JCM 16511]